MKEVVCCDCGKKYNVFSNKPKIWAVYNQCKQCFYNEHFGPITDREVLKMPVELHKKIINAVGGTPIDAHTLIWSILEREILELESLDCDLTDVALGFTLKYRK